MACCGGAKHTPVLSKPESLSLKLNLDKYRFHFNGKKTSGYQRDEKEYRHKEGPTPQEELLFQRTEFEKESLKNRELAENVRELKEKMDKSHKEQMVKLIECEYLRNELLNDLIKYEDVADYEPKDHPI